MTGRPIVVLPADLPVGAGMGVMLATPPCATCARKARVKVAGIWLCAACSYKQAAA